MLIRYYWSFAHKILLICGTYLRGDPLLIRYCWSVGTKGGPFAYKILLIRYWSVRLGGTSLKLALPVYIIDLNCYHIQIGDELIDVNGHGLVGVAHKDAIRLLKSSNTLMVTVRVKDVRPPFSLSLSLCLSPPSLSLSVSFFPLSLSLSLSFRLSLLQFLT